MSTDKPGAPDPSMARFQSLVSALAADANRILRKDPAAEIVGIIAESGTTECKRARTIVEQRTGKEFGAENFAGIIPPALLPQILDKSFPPDAIKWMMSRDQKREFQIIICAKNEVRVATIAIPDAPGGGPG